MRVARALPRLHRLDKQAGARPDNEFRCAQPDGGGGAPAERAPGIKSFLTFRLPDAGVAGSRFSRLTNKIAPHFRDARGRPFTRTATLIKRDVSGGMAINGLHLLARNLAQVFYT